MAIEITNNNYEDIVKYNDVVLIDFWATWCGPCQMLGPVVSQLADELDGTVVVGKCDVDENEELAIKFGVNTIPNLVLIKDGEILDRSIGYKDFNALKNWVLSKIN